MVIESCECCYVCRRVTVLPEEDLPIMDRLSQISQNLDDIEEISEEEKVG